MPAKEQTIEARRQIYNHDPTRLSAIAPGGVRKTGAAEKRGRRLLGKCLAFPSLPAASTSAVINL